MHGWHRLTQNRIGTITINSILRSASLNSTKRGISRSNPRRWSSRSGFMTPCCLDDAGLPITFINCVRKLVMATKRHQAEPDSDEAVMVDVDLSILGQGQKRFAEYEDQIRQEYAWVSNQVFTSKRTEILEGFLARKQIFVTKLFTTDMNSVPAAIWEFRC